MLELQSKIKEQAAGILESNIPLILQDLNAVAIKQTDGKIPEIVATLKVKIGKEGKSYSYVSGIEWKELVKHSDASELETYDPKQLTLELNK